MTNSLSIIIYSKTSQADQICGHMIMTIDKMQYMHMIILLIHMP